MGGRGHRGDAISAFSHGQRAMDGGRVRVSVTFHHVRSVREGFACYFMQPRSGYDICTQYSPQPPFPWTDRTDECVAINRCDLRLADEKVRRRRAERGYILGIVDRYM